MSRVRTRKVSAITEREAIVAWLKHGAGLPETHRGRVYDAVERGEHHEWQRRINELNAANDQDEE